MGSQKPNFQIQDYYGKEPEPMTHLGTKGKPTIFMVLSRIQFLFTLNIMQLQDESV